MRFRPWLLVVTVLYLMAIAWMTLRPEVYGSRTSELLWRFLDEFAQHRQTAWITFDVVESVSNAVMFVPLGFLLALFFPKRLFIVAILLCIALSWGIETYQGEFLSSTRVSDPGDIVHNSVGGAVGVGVALVLRLLFLPFALLGRGGGGRRGRGRSGRRDAVGLVR